MNSLTITQKTSETERYVPNEVITTLYNIGKDDDEHQTLTSGVDTTDSNRPVTSVAGSVAVRVAYANQIEYLATKFPNLNISTDSTYIYFADPEVERVLLANGIGDGTGISLQDATNANLGTIFKNNTTITSFNEFGRFNRANDNPSNNMFEGCSSLGQIDQSNITALGDRQFYGTGITTVNMPNLSVLNGHEQFANCHDLVSVQNLGAITNLSNTMFYNCTNLESVILPATITTIRVNDFNSCYKLKTINLQNISAIDNNGLRETLLTDVNINDLQNLVSVGEFAFLLTRISGVLNLPKLITIGSQAFDRCSLITGIECLGKLSTISNSRVFYGTGVTYVKLPYECTTIGYSAFEECSNLTSIKQYTDSIDNWVEGVEPTTGPLNRVTSFGDKCFYNCSVLQLTQQDIQNATSIGNSAFVGTLLSGTIDLPNIQNVGRAAFEGTKITSVINLGSVTEIPSYCFDNCKELTNIIIRPGITSIGDSAFQGAKLSNIILPYGFKVFGNGGTPIKGSCNNITYMQFPSTTTKINFWDIYRDSNPVTAFCVVQATTPPNTGRDSNDTAGAGIGWGWGRPQLSRWYVPDSVVNVYKENEQWSPLADYIFPISQLETDSPVNWQLYQTNKDYGVS